MTEIQKRLFALQDKEYQAFTAKLNPTVDPETIIGVRLPALRALAKELKNTDEAKDFLSSLPHEYLEENHLHSFLLSGIKDFDEGIAAVERFLPYIDNWAVCDSLRIKALAKYPERLLPYLEKWMKSDHTYTVRCGILNLMNYFLDDRFDEKYPAMVAAVHCEEYYVNMMIAWYFATALAKQYDAALPYLTEQRLDKWVHNKTIQKAVESYRITDEQKAYLKTLRRK
ncbi:MAG: DNA alkylation repair protein [Ruminococcus sp.]|uniref:DNA alkylation repair protein n=1 Tax=Ruminococcus sp. TaxID=41978 RepID=UPI002873A56E|nr:DNA alkylation repair protein [Ruminococcus sp.]MBQ3285300.1 DNA alkylation repair protein [Ruminococcus sp.]